MIFDFKTATPGNRIIVKNIAGDQAFGGDIPGEQEFGETDRIMAFDVILPLDNSRPDVIPTGIIFGPNVPEPTRLRKVALFEGRDEFGRLQPMLGTAEPATDYAGNPINWPDTPKYINAGLVSQMEGSFTWDDLTTENPALNSTEEWEIWNATGDAHPVHVHLVNFEVLGRQAIVWDSHTTEDTKVISNEEYNAPAGDGTYLISRNVALHNEKLGKGFQFVNLTYGEAVTTPPEYVENAPKDMVTARPGEITRIKATFNKPGLYVWHCHILSHEDHNMMRHFYVGPEITGISETSDETPITFELEQNYPNPFNPKTNIRFILKKDADVEIMIYDILGNEIRSLIKNKYLEGKHSVIWNSKDNNGQGVASGTYIYRMTVGNVTLTKKMMLLR